MGDMKTEIRDLSSINWIVQKDLLISEIGLWRKTVQSFVHKAVYLFQNKWMLEDICKVNSQSC